MGVAQKPRSWPRDQLYSGVSGSFYIGGDSHDCMPNSTNMLFEVKTMIKPEAVFRKMPW